MSSNKAIHVRSRLKFFTLIAGIGLLVMVKSVQGQEALRISMAGDLAAESQKQVESSIGYYNLLLGPVAWRFSSGLGLEFDDNVRLEQTGESDLIIRPSVNAQMHWPVTAQNSLDVSLGAGYSEYLQHSDLSEFFINPGSGFSFDIYAGDFKINLHDRITITENAYENTGSGGNRNLVSLENTVGTSALWDLDTVVANFGYDHVNYVSLLQSQQPDAASENVSVNAGIRVLPELMLGLEAGGTVISYSQTSMTNTLPVPDAVQWSIGTFGSAQVSDYLSVRADAGYTDYAPDNTTTNLVLQDSSGFYLSFTLSHRVNQFVNYTLTAGRSTDLSAYGQVQSYYFVRLTPNWIFFRKCSVSTPVWWQQGNRVYNTIGGGNADYDQLGIGLNVSRAITEKLSAGINYQFVHETSNQTGLNYTVNIAGLNLSYQF